MATDTVPFPVLVSETRSMAARASAVPSIDGRAAVARASPARAPTPASAPRACRYTRSSSASRNGRDPFSTRPYVVFAGETTGSAAAFRAARWTAARSAVVTAASARSIATSPSASAPPGWRVANVAASVALLTSNRIPTMANGTRARSSSASLTPTTS